eukprot:TRINITY_DN11850_c0_g1_i2.p2 TRINITY_DN11850_c0_g1~~TRINITY_DN11850_c0_g1_i2.p2  ORF type:complete len:165 (+),score=16.36 TRINITY_DN11850_c0_g1_i2:98-592(+)
MAVIAVGTTNACKLQALEKTIAMYSKLAALKVQGMKVDTGVAEQPKSMDETTCGAKNRAEKAFAGIEGAAYGVGMESGLFRVDGKMFDVCAASFFDGDKHHVGWADRTHDHDCVASYLFCTYVEGLFVLWISTEQIGTNREKCRWGRPHARPRLRCCMFVLCFC